MRHYTPHGWVEEPANAIREWGEEDDYSWALKDLGTTPEAFVSAVVYALAWNLKGGSANITGIYCDQWCGISAEGAPFETGGLLAMTGEQGKVSCFVQCDRVEWGLGKVWRIMSNEFNTDNEPVETGQEGETHVQEDDRRQ